MFDDLALEILENGVGPDSRSLKKIPEATIIRRISAQGIATFSQSGRPREETVM